MNQITMMEWLVTQRWTFWSAESSRLQEALLLTKPVDAMKFQIPKGGCHQGIEQLIGSRLAGLSAVTLFV